MDSLHEPNGRRSPGMHATLSVLEALVTRAPLSLTDLAAGLEAPKSSVYRVCTVLVERGWLVRNPDGRYDLGIRAFGLSPRSSDFPLVRAFRGIAADLLTRHNETVALAVLDADESVYIALEETSHPVRLVTHVGNRTPAFASASGYDFSTFVFSSPRWAISNRARNASMRSFMTRWVFTTKMEAAIRSITFPM